MSRRGLSALIAILLVVLAVLAWRLRAGPRTPAVQDALALQHPTRPAFDTVVPSRANVAPAFAREVAELEHRVAARAADTAALLRLARLHQDAHQPARAAGYYRSYLELAPADRQAWLDLATVAAAASDWNGALEATNTLLARDSLDAAALFNRGAIHANRGELAEARRWWGKAAAQTRDRELAAQAAAALRRLQVAGQ